MPIAVLLSLAMGLVACSEKRPSNVFADDLMEDVLYDYHIARAMGEELAKSEPHTRLLYANAVFEKHGVTEAEFDSSMVWYARHPETLAEIYDRVEDRLRAQREVINRLMALKNQQPGETLAGDSIDVWPWQRTYRITGQPLDNKRTFTLEGDSNFQDRDSLVWSMRVRLYQQPIDTALAPVMALQVAYENDSVRSGLRRLAAHDSTYTIALQADTFGSIREVRGFIYTPNTGHSYGMGLRADQIRLMRYHAKDSLRLPDVGVDGVPRGSVGDAADAVQAPDSASKKSTATPAQRTVPRAKPSANATKSGAGATASPTKKATKSTKTKQTSSKTNTKKKSTTTGKKNNKGTSGSKRTPATNSRAVPQNMQPTKVAAEEEEQVDLPVEDRP